MGDESTSFDSKRKPLRCSFIPPLKGLFRGQAVKGDIQLDRVKILGVEFEPLFLAKVRRVKDVVPPMGIIITARSDKDHIVMRQGQSPELHFL